MWVIIKDIRVNFLIISIIFILFKLSIFCSESKAIQSESTCDSAQRIFYVATDGDDSNPGTIERPWKTIQKAAEALQAGDTVYIRAGTYHERVIPKNSGSENCYITYMAYPGEDVIIDGSGIKLPDDLAGLFEISDKGYIKVIGLKIINAGLFDNNAGIFVIDSSHIIIQDNYIYNTVSSGIGIWNSKAIIVDGNEVVLACNDGEQECITVAGTDTFEVKNNHVHHSGPGSKGGEGIDIKDGSRNGKVFKNRVHDLNNRVGIYIDAWDKHTYDIEVFKNLVFNIFNNDGIAIGSEKGGLLENITIYDNIIYNNGLSGITLSDAGDSQTHPLKDIKIINNTIYKNGGSNNWGGGISIENSDIEGLLIRNNICSKNVFFQIQREAEVKNFKIDHNLIDGFRGYDDEILGNEYILEDPRFVNPDKGDFHLKFGSPAIDMGSANEAPQEDFEGCPRPINGKVDIGVYEYYLKGDIDGDGNITLTDVILILRILSGEDIIIPFCWIDVNGDGKLGLDDGIYIIQRLAELR